MYDFLGYYQICYLGDEVSNPSRTIPRSILISVAVVAVVYLMMNIGILGVLPWREVVSSKHIASDLMLRVHGPRAAALATAMIIWTALASVYAALLGYSRIPYASARAGHFFKAFAQTHPTGHFPHRSLLLISGIATLACLANLETVISGAADIAHLDPVCRPDCDGLLPAKDGKGPGFDVPHAPLSLARPLSAGRLAVCLLHVGTESCWHMAFCRCSQAWPPSSVWNKAVAAV